MAYAERIAACRRVREPNMEKMAELLEKMKGGRSYNQYAKDVGAAASSLTRIANKEANKVSDDLLGKLLDNMAPGCGVTFEEVIEANGMAEDSRISFRQGTDRFETTAKEVISYDLFRAGKSAVLGDEGRYRGFRFGRARPSMVIKTNAVDGEEGVWAFDVRYFPETRPDDRGQMNDTRFRASRLRENIGGMMADFYAGTDIKKWSLVVNNKEAFDLLVENCMTLLDGNTIKDRISIILINEEERYVEDEWTFPTGASTIQAFPLEPERTNEEEPDPDDEEYDFFKDLPEGKHNLNDLFDYIRQMERKIKALEAANNNKEGDV